MKKKLILTLLAAACVVLLGGCTKTLKLADYMDYKLSGRDGYGSLTEKFDKSAFAEAVAEAAGYSDKRDDYLDKLEQIEEDIDDFLYGEWSETDHLSNGDEIRYSWEISEDAFQKYKVKLDRSDFTAKIPEDALKALKELKHEDVLTIAPEGYSGAGTVRVRLNTDELTKLDFTVEGNSDTLSNGDILKITLKEEDGKDLSEYLGQKGYKLSDPVLNYTVKDLKEPERVDPFDYFTLQFSGYSGAGQAEWSVKDSAPDAVWSLSFSLDKSKDLSNGETIHVNAKPSWWDADTEMYYLRRQGILFTVFEKDYTVEELEEPTKVDPFDYLELNFSGVSGYAAVSWSWKENAPAVLYELEVSFSRKDGLSNGDEMTATVSRSWTSDLEYFCLSSYGAILNETEHVYILSGIEEARELDVFDYITVSFEGISGSGKASYAVNKENEYADLLDSLSYSLSERNNLSLGSEIRLTVSRSWDDVEEYCMKKFGIRLKATEKSYTVDGLSHYLSDIADLSEETLKTMKENAENGLKAYVARSWSKPDTYLGMKYVGSYVLASKKAQYSNNSYLYLIFLVSAQDMKTKETFTYYYYTLYTDLVIGADGSFLSDADSFKTVSKSFSRSAYYYNGYADLDKLYSECVTARIDNYNVQENMPE